MPESEDRKNELVFRLVYIGFLISGAIALLVIGGVIVISLYAAIKGGSDLKVPDVLANWGGVIVGFYFGAFISLIKDYMKAQ